MKHQNFVDWKHRCFQKYWYPKMDGENNASKPYEQMDDLGG